MGINELRFDWAFLQWVVMAVVGVYTWLIGRQSASQKELLELRTRITTVEAQIKSVPTQSQITELIAKLSRTEAQMTGMQEQMAATYRRTENIEAYLLQKK
ncbi:MULTISPECIES: DUF2730 family protein [Enterobacterales]|uniref:DUF2730 family protein n=1 Tax=Enterobacterales TaxID=91347 RepID=UPI0007CBD166|nr:MULTISPECIES: DUF2730 family protein [Enterobacterales]PHY69814.1 DUF2730 domain-containing protein [Serratia marcescens]PIC09995.1 DUF2730 domain-containing protein [Serratia marcescens]SBL76444.1 Protein of uncharacterised function (DUF2730) [Klebsiella oxytoca]HAT2880312.1 DUF2730 family protein [Serratia marcescens]HAT2891566.1 DUF2730 family protein [Serratia marcescens]